MKSKMCNTSLKDLGKTLDSNCLKHSFLSERLKILSLAHVAKAEVSDLLFCDHSDSLIFSWHRVRELHGTQSLPVFSEGTEDLFLTFFL